MKPFVYILLALVLWSCGSKRSTSEAYNVSEEMLNSYWTQQVNPAYLTLKGAVSMQDQGSTTSAAIQLRMQKDSVIWASITIMGMFEGFRAYITTDSVHLLDRINKTYTGRSVNYLKQLIGLDVELSEVQNILIGNAPFKKGLYETVEQDSSLHLEGRKAALLNHLFLNKAQRTHLSKFKSESRADSISFSYGDYEDLGDLKMPTAVSADLLLGNRRSIIDLEYRSAKTDSIATFAFTIPSSYKRI